MTVHSIATASSGTSAVIIAALVSGFGALIVGVLNYRAQGRVVVTSRFSQAVPQLGDETPDVRVGAIYALEQILHTSRPERRAIIELLVSYVLGHANLAARRDGEPDDDASLDDLPNLRDWAPDVQAAVVVLSRRPRTTIRQALRGSGDDHFHNPYGSAFIDVGHADLRRAELVDADLSRTKLYHVRFERAVLHRANLNGADRSRARLKRADLGDSTLIETKLVGAVLTEADLGGARLRRANLAEADLFGPASNTQTYGTLTCAARYSSMPQVSWTRTLPAPTPTRRPRGRGTSRRRTTGSGSARRKRGVPAPSSPDAYQHTTGCAQCVAFGRVSKITLTQPTSSSGRDQRTRPPE